MENVISITLVVNGKFTIGDLADISANYGAVISRTSITVSPVGADMYEVVLTFPPKGN